MPDLAQSQAPQMELGHPAHFIQRHKVRLGDHKGSSNSRPLGPNLVLSACGGGYREGQMLEQDSEGTWAWLQRTLNPGRQPPEDSELTS